MAISISDKADFRTMKITGDKGRHQLMIKASINQEDRMSPSVYIPNNRPQKT